MASPARSDKAWRRGTRPGEMVQQFRVGCCVRGVGTCARMASVIVVACGRPSSGKTGVPCPASHRAWPAGEKMVFAIRFWRSIRTKPEMRLRGAARVVPDRQHPANGAQQASAPHPPPRYRALACLQRAAPLHPCRVSGLHPGTCSCRRSKSLDRTGRAPPWHHAARHRHLLDLSHPLYGDDR